MTVKIINEDRDEYGNILDVYPYMIDKTTGIVFYAEPGPTGKVFCLSELTVVKN